MNRGEIWTANLDPSVGAEIKKTRPCVIVSRDSIGKLPLKIVVPLTHWRDEFDRADWLIRIEPTSSNGLMTKSAADTFQVRSISENRLVEKIGQMAEVSLAEINQGLILSLGLE
jgi:mRNA interferase MazF